MQPSELIGQTKEELDTPVLLVDLDVLEQNIQKMADTIVREAGVNWRPHTKAMKTPALAHKALAAGAMGVTCAKLGEAEVMAAAGIRDILIANQVVGPKKTVRLAYLNRQAEVKVAVDSVENVEGLSRAARAAGVTLRLLIEINTGMNRAGLEPGEPVLHLAQEIARRDGVQFAGLMTWESIALMIENPEEKRRVVADALKKVRNTAELCRKNGLPVEIVSCGGTGTYWLSAFEPGVTEIQAGGGVFCDLKYRNEFGVHHEYALTILSTVTSRPTPERIICDAGMKTMSAYTGEPEPIGISGLESLWLSAEHGILLLEDPSETPKVGEKIEFVTGYSDTTVFLHDELIGIRSGRVEVVWPLLGRGKLK